MIVKLNSVIEQKDELVFFSNIQPVRCGQPPTLAWLELWEAAMEKVTTLWGFIQTCTHENCKFK